MSDEEFEDIFPESIQTVASGFDVSFGHIIGESSDRNFVVPQPPVGYPCSKCHKSYKTKKNLASHLREHALRDAARHAVSVSSIKEESSNLTKSSLTALAQAKVNGNPGQAVQDSCISVLLLEGTQEWNDLANDLGNCVVECLPTTFKSPSELRSAFITSFHLATTRTDFRNRAGDRLSALGVGAATIWLFLGLFVQCFSDNVMSMVFSSMRHSELGSIVAVQHSLTLKEKQLCHYIAGFVTLSLLRQGRSRKDTSFKWKRVVSCILACFRDETGGEVSSDPDIHKWAALLDRDAVIFVGQKAMDFFLLCGFIAKGVNPPSRNNFLRQAFQSLQLVCVRDEIVEGRLFEDESAWLMGKRCTLFYNTYGKGTASKARNDRLSKVQACVGTRKKLSRK